MALTHGPDTAVDIDAAAEQAIGLLLADPATRANPYSVYGALLAQRVYRTPLDIWKADARQRLRGRDEEDWPVLATALSLSCAIWTEDTDFFGTGVAVWTSDRVEIFLRGQSKPDDLEEF